MALKNEQLGESSQGSRLAMDFWRTGLLLISSAALGGIAVAIWNRRTLAKMRQDNSSRTEEGPAGRSSAVDPEG